MSSFNASSVSKSQQWRNDLVMKSSDPISMSTNEIFKEPAQQKYLSQLSQAGQLGQPGQPSQPVHPGHPSHAGHPGQTGQLGQPGHVGHSGHAGLPGHASGQPGQRSHQMLTNASVCCEQPNCDRAKIEQMPEQYFQEPATPFTLMNPAQGRDPQSGKKEPSAPASDHDYMYCPCGRGGQLVTICCTGRNCDNASKIDEGIHMAPPEVHMCHPEVHMCPQDVQLGSPDVNLGPREEKRAKTSFNQYKY